MAYNCLANSLTLDFLKQITADLSYHLPAIMAVNGEISAGPLLLKLISSQARMDFRVIVSFIRTSLTQLDAKMIELDSSIIEFNLHVTAQIKALSHTGKTTDNCRLKGVTRLPNEHGHPVKVSC